MTGPGPPPPGGPGRPHQVGPPSPTLTQAYEHNHSKAHKCPFEGPRQHIDEWRRLGADKVLLRGIQAGARAPLHSAPPPCDPAVRPHPPGLTTTIGEYLEEGVLAELPPSDARQTKFWVPVFGRPKKDSDKVRMISDLRRLNACHQVPHHRSETWKHVLEVLQRSDCQWGVTMDLKSWFHHLQLHRTIRRWTRFRTALGDYEMVAMPFGWSMSPWWSNKLSKPIRAWLHRRQWPYCWWVDDILVLGRSKQEAEHRAARLSDLLTGLGITINCSKSMPAASQHILYLGHHISLDTGIIHHCPSKTSQLTTMTTNLHRRRQVQPTMIAGLAGALLDAARINANLLGLPQVMMRHAGHLVSHNAREMGRWAPQAAWRRFTTKPPGLDQLLTTVGRALRRPTPRPYRHSSDDGWLLRSDASDEAWGGSCTTTAGRWPRPATTGRRG